MRMVIERRSDEEKGMYRMGAIDLQDGRLCSLEITEGREDIRNKLVIGRVLECPPLESQSGSDSSKVSLPASQVRLLGKMDAESLWEILRQCAGTRLAAFFPSLYAIDEMEVVCSTSELQAISCWQPILAPSALEMDASGKRWLYFEEGTSVLRFQLLDPRFFPPEALAGKSPTQGRWSIVPQSMILSMGTRPRAQRGVDGSLSLVIEAVHLFPEPLKDAALGHGLTLDAFLHPPSDQESADVSLCEELSNEIPQPCSISSSFTSEALSLLRKLLKDPQANFRPGQLSAIERLCEGKERLLLVQRTGWGKSIVYFLATYLLRQRGAGPTFLISPLLSLMRNQIEMAERIGIRAVTLHSENFAEWSDVRNKLRAGACDVLLVSPER